MTQAPTTPPPPPPHPGWQVPEVDAAAARAARPWWRKKRFVIPLILFGPFALFTMAVIGALLAASDEPGQASGSEPVPAQASELELEPTDEAPDEKATAIGQPTADGQFTFTVNGLDCGATTVGDDFFAQDAQGQWCALALTVENTGTEARRLSASNQYLYDTQERRYSASTRPGVPTPIYEQVNPGITIEGTIYFDVPDGFDPASVELHDSPVSRGVLVSLD